MSCLPTFVHRRSNKVQPDLKKKGHRKLHQSKASLFWMVSLAAVWGILVIVLNIQGYLNLMDIAGPCVTFNIVNFVNVIYARNLFYIQELVARPKLPSDLPALRAIVKTKIDDLTRQFFVMAYGKEALPEALRSDPHFAAMQHGVAYSIKQGADLLFWTTKCLCLDPADCKQPSDPLYKVVMQGINPIFVTFLETGNVIAKITAPLDPAVGGPEFNFYWRTRPDMEGGLAQLSHVYEEHVIDTYDRVIHLHIILLVLSVLLLLGFLLLVLWPFVKRISNETRRIAELLCQLPAEVDVQSLLQRTLMPAPPNASLGAPKSLAPQLQGAERGSLQSRMSSAGTLKRPSSVVKHATSARFGSAL